MDYYRRLVDGLADRGVEPSLTLFHWDLPQVLQDRGGWADRDCASWFADYAEVVAAELGDRVTRWITLNEPAVVADRGYRRGDHPPGLQDPDKRWLLPTICSSATAWPRSDCGPFSMTARRSGSPWTPRTRWLLTLTMERSPTRSLQA